jgi:hypothetical protein
MRAHCPRYPCNVNSWTRDTAQNQKLFDFLFLYILTVSNKKFCEEQVKESNLCYYWRSVGQSVLVSSAHLWPKTRFLLLSDSCGFVDVGRPFLREDGSLSYKCCPSSPAQNRKTEPELLYDWRFTANQFGLASCPLRLATKDFFSLATEPLRSWSLCNILKDNLIQLIIINNYNSNYNILVFSPKVKRSVIWDVAPGTPVKAKRHSTSIFRVED